jgi:hypothetical protein
MEVRMGIPRVEDKEISPIYRKLYRQVANLPAMEDLKERVIQAIRDTELIRYTYNKQEYWNRININMSLSVGGRTVKTQFTLAGDEVPGFELDTDHLTDEAELLGIFWENVGYEGKRIKMHGLCQSDTVNHGAAPRGKNRFGPWMLWHIFGSDEVQRAKEATKSRIGREIQASLKKDSSFQGFAEELTTQDMIDKLGEYSYLPPETLHRMVDLMYVKMAMEE